MATVRLEQQQTSGGVGNVDFDLAYNRPKYDGEEMTGQTDIPRVPEEIADLKDGYRVESLENNLADATKELQEDIANEALERANADEALTSNFDLIRETNIQLDTAVSADESTVTITKTNGHLLRGDRTDTAMPLPVASATSAGVMNAATFNAIQGNSERLDAIIEGAVAIDTLPETPTQEELTEAYKTATGQEDVMNRASIYDDVHKKIYYYYTNVNEWKAGDISSQITISQATNDTAGIVKGSTNPGQIAVEPDGTMSLNGYDGIQHDLENLTALVDGKDMPTVNKYVVSSDESQPLQVADNGHIVYRTVDSVTGDTNDVDLAINLASSTEDGLLSKEDKSKLESMVQITALGAGLALDENGALSVIGEGGETGLTQEAIIRANNLPTQVFYNTGPTDYNSDALEVHLILKDLHTGGDAAMPFTINGAVAASGDIAGKAGVMTADQATKLSRVPEKICSEFTQSPLQEADHVEISYTETNTATGEETYPKIRISEATSTQAGVMTAADKAKLDSLGGSGTIVEKIPVHPSETNPINVDAEKNLSDYDALLIRFTANGTYMSDVLNRNVDFQCPSQTLATITRRYGDNNQFAEWNSSAPYTCEPLYFNKPRRMSPYVAVMGNSIQLTLHISNAALIDGNVDWMNGTENPPTNVTVIGFKFPSE